MDINDKIAAFDPNGMGELNGNIYGLPFSREEAKLVILPVPWEVTVSYSAGTAEAPEAIMEASYQVDLFDPFVPDAWKLGIAMKELDEKLKWESHTNRQKAENYLEKLALGTDPATDTELQSLLTDINSACQKMNQWVKNESLNLLDKNKLVGLVGGDHSTPLGLMQALAEKHETFGVLHIDAHADLREAYEGFEFSHASIMFNAIKIPQISHLVQVGIRDYCEAELRLIQTEKRISTFFDRDIKQEQFDGTTWASICKQVIDKLPQKVYLSFDIDGLDPKLCPNTGTPVPGGLELEQSLYLIEKLVNSGKTNYWFRPE